MGKKSTQAKQKYNKLAYVRYEFNVRADTKLNHALEEYKINPENSLSALVRELLCNHFGVSEHEIYVPYHFERINGEIIKAK